MQQSSGTVAFDGFQGLIHDIGDSNPTRRAVDLKEFTANFSSNGIGPTRGLTIAHFTKKGQALSWNFKLVEPGTYRVEVAHMTRGNTPWVTDGRMRATVGGELVEGDLQETRRVANPKMPTVLTDSIASLGTITIESPGTHTFKLEISSDLNASNLAFRGVTLVPAD